jgi:hypothetical protein
MMTITISANNLAEFKAEIAKLTELLEPKIKINIPPTPEVVAPTPEPEKPKAKSKPEAKRVAVAKPDVSFEDAKAALKELNVKKGIEVARATLKTLGVAKMSDLQPAQYAPLVAACGEQLLV